MLHASKMTKEEVKEMILKRLGLEALASSGFRCYQLVKLRSGAGIRPPRAVKRFGTNVLTGMI